LVKLLGNIESGVVVEQISLQEAQHAKQAAASLGRSSAEQRNRALLLAAGLLRERQDEILAANLVDQQQATQENISRAMLDRLSLNAPRVEAIAKGLEEVAALADPLHLEDSWRRPNAILIRRVRVPLGLIAIIYEARPNVTVEAAALCIKSGNACLLRGSRSAVNSNRVLVKLLAQACESVGFSPNVVTGLSDTRRESIDFLCNLRGVVDCLIPRGGAELISRVVSQARVPVLETGVGNCHMYVHTGADWDMACSLIINSKCSRPAVCNSLEAVLVDASIASAFLARLIPQLLERKVELRGCPRALAIHSMTAATEIDWCEEFLDLILAVKIVDGMDEALEHIQRYGSQHTEAIVTNDLSAARRFQSEVDACAVSVNASTRFTDGGQFGFGAEIGISTQKFHARGPVGLAQLTSVKYLVEGQGQIRE
jgi:glutamate-5-semialdehyde dehydrogenase